MDKLFQCERIKEAVLRAKSELLLPIIKLSIKTASFTIVHLLTLFVLFTVKYITSQRGKTLIIVDGYRFCFQRKIGLKKRWMCSSHHHHGKYCGAYLHTLENQIIKVFNNHNHGIRIQ